MGMTPLALVVLSGCFGLDEYKDPVAQQAGDSGAYFPDGETGDDDSGLHPLGDSGADGNSAPTADAGGDVATWVGDVVDLDGTLSNDPDGDTLEFTWFLVSRPGTSAAELINEDRSAASIYIDAEGTYEIQLTVTDGGRFDSDTAVLTAEKLNGEPVARAGLDQSVTEGDRVTLDGSGSYDADGDTLTYSWSMLSRPGTSLATLTDPTSPTPRFTADQAGTFELELVVNDGKGDSAPDGVRVQANATSSGGSGGSGSGGSSCSCGEVQDEVERRYPLARALPTLLGLLPAVVIFGVRRRDD